jgi:hypothetical protein
VKTRLMIAVSERRERLTLSVEKDEQETDNRRAGAQAPPDLRPKHLGSIKAVGAEEPVKRVLGRTPHHLAEQPTWLRCEGIDELLGEGWSGNIL